MAYYTIQLRRGLAAAWTAANPILSLGEVGLETDSRKFKAGDGVTAWASLLYFGSTTIATTPLVLKGDNAGNAVAAVAGTDFCGITSGTSVLKASSGNTATALASDVIALFTGTPTGAKFARDDGTLAIPAGGATIATTKLPLKGDNVGNAVAQVIQQVGDVSATITAGTNVVLLTTALTATRTLTLPAASGYAAGDTITIIDPKRAATCVNTVLLARAGADTINGAATTITILNAPGQTCAVQLDSSGTNWGTPSSIMVNPANASGVVGASEWFVRGPSNAGIGSASGGTGAQDLVLFSNNAGNATLQNTSACFAVSNNFGLGFSSGSFSFSSFPDTAFNRNAAGVAEVNNGTAGTFRDLKLSHLLMGGTAPTAAAGTGAGTGPTITVVAGSNDLAGQIQVLTGTVPTAAATVMTMTLNRAFPTRCFVLLTPANATTAALSGTSQVFTPIGGTSTWLITAGSAALVATTTYLWNYTVIGN